MEVTDYVSTSEDCSDQIRHGANGKCRRHNGEVDKWMFFTKFELRKGYWQIPVGKRLPTVFKGSFHLKKMSIGMVNSGATFNRIMRKLMSGREFVDSYVDGMIGHTTTWRCCRSYSEEKLTVKPPKCFVGFNIIGFIFYRTYDWQWSSPTIWHRFNVLFQMRLFENLPLDLHNLSKFW